MTTTRRGFLQQSAAMGATTAAPWLASLAAISEASAQTLPSDYKALVCVFLIGGNDHANTMIPVDLAANGVDKPGFDNYIQHRPEIAYQWDELKLGPTTGPGSNVDLLTGNRAAVPGATSMAPVKDLVVQGTGGRNFAFSPPLTELKQNWYDTGKLAVVLNVGPLVEPTVGYRNPTTKELFFYGYTAQGAIDTTRQATLPPRLGSHNDQQLIWQASNPEGAVNGWGGYIADQTGGSPGNRVFSCMSVAGNTVFLTGNTTLPYQVTTANSLSVPLGSLRSSVYGSTACANVLGQIITGQGLGTTAQAVLEKDLTTVVRRSISADDVLRNMTRVKNDPDYAALNLVAEDGRNGGQDYPGIDLARQLRTVAHLINNREKLGASVGRQVFFVQLYTFDTHSKQNAEHPWLLRQVSLSLDAFYKDLEHLGLQDKVTTFTASDFGRTFNSNGDGTDHGWGSHHFVMGGAVNGGKLYGKAPTFVPDGPSAAGPQYRDDTGRGRLIPSTSVTQYAATLARWMDVPEPQLPNVLPNLNKFNIPGWGTDLDFMV